MQEKDLVLEDNMKTLDTDIWGQHLHNETPNPI